MYSEPMWVVVLELRVTSTQGLASVEISRCGFICSPETPPERGVLECEKVASYFALRIVVSDGFHCAWLSAISHVMGPMIVGS